MHITHLTILRFVDVVHPSSLCQGLQGRERQALDLLVGFLQEEVVQGGVHIFLLQRPLHHTNFKLDRRKEFYVWTRPATKEVVQKGILSPSIIRLVEQSDKKLQLS